jgi:predicted metalloendopeptidase
MLSVKAETDLKALIDEQLAEAPAPGTDARRVADYYRAYADSDAIERAGLGPVAGELKEIASLASHREIGRFMARPSQP